MKEATILKPDNYNRYFIFLVAAGLFSTCYIYAAVRDFLKLQHVIANTYTMRDQHNLLTHAGPTNENDLYGLRGGGKGGQGGQGGQCRGLLAEQIEQILMQQPEWNSDILVTDEMVTLFLEYLVGPCFIRNMSLRHLEGLPIQERLDGVKRIIDAIDPKNHTGFVPIYWFDDGVQGMKHIHELVTLDDNTYSALNRYDELCYILNIRQG